jgi:hypothetical protein
MLLGFPFDYWTQEHIQNAIRPFGRVIMWDVDRANLTRLLVRACVTSLEEIPQFIVFSVAEGFQGVSWMVQCEIIQQNMLGGMPEDEEEVLSYPQNGNQLLVEYMGLGQPVAPTGFDLNIPPVQNGNINEDKGWDAWPIEEQF